MAELKAQVAGHIHMGCWLTLLLQDNTPNTSHTYITRVYILSTNMQITWHTALQLRGTEELGVTYVQHTSLYTKGRGPSQNKTVYEDSYPWNIC